MCGRYALYDTGVLQSRFDTLNQLKLQPHYNVAPGVSMPVVTRNSPNKQEVMRWGLIPFWAKDPKIGYRMINARVENINQKPAFKKPFATQRCLVPANGFYEWKKTRTVKIPFYFHLPSHQLFSFAGLYDIWQDDQGNQVKSFTIITTQANGVVGLVHDRMPVILEKSKEQVWLDPTSNQAGLVSLLQPRNDEMLHGYPVSSEVNATTADTPDLIAPANPLLGL